MSRGQTEIAKIREQLTEAEIEDILKQARHRNSFHPDRYDVDAIEDALRPNKGVFNKIRPGGPKIADPGKIARQIRELAQEVGQEAGHRTVIEELREQVTDKEVQELHRRAKDIKGISQKDVEKAFFEPESRWKQLKLRRHSYTRSAPRFVSIVKDVLEDIRQDHTGEDVPPEEVGKVIPGFKSAYKKLSSGSFKSVYLSRKDQKIVYVPKIGGTLETRMAQVKAWKHNAEVLRRRGLRPAADSYDIVVTHIRGIKYPLLVCEFHGDLQVGGTHYREHREEYDYVGKKIEQLVADGAFAAAARDDWTGKDAAKNLGYRPDIDRIVVVDLGELSMSHRGRGHSKDAQKYLAVSQVKEKAADWRNREGLPPISPQDMRHGIEDVFDIRTLAEEQVGQFEDRNVFFRSIYDEYDLYSSMREVLESFSRKWPRIQKEMAGREPSEQEMLEEAYREPYREGLKAAIKNDAGPIWEHRRGENGVPIDAHDFEPAIRSAFNIREMAEIYAEQDRYTTDRAFLESVHNTFMDADSIRKAINHLPAEKRDAVERFCDGRNNCLQEHIRGPYSVALMSAVSATIGEDLFRKAAIDKRRG